MRRWSGQFSVAGHRNRRAAPSGCAWYCVFVSVRRLTSEGLCYECQPREYLRVVCFREVVMLRGLPEPGIASFCRLTSMRASGNVSRNLSPPVVAMTGWW